MARPRNDQKHIALAAEELVKALTRFISTAADTMQGGQSSEAMGPKAKPRKPSPGRLRQIAAMKAYWKKRNAEKANGGK
ncbi:MAG: hypothetical protein JNM10_18880 [Planctomycetia bacterium]|nr:hypothetical protein [Planctomycetia bacterium]